MPAIDSETRLTREIEIIRAAWPSIELHGVDATSMDDIAKAAGLSVGALYRYFSSKDEIVAAVFENAFGQVATLVGKLTTALPLGGADGFARAIANAVDEHVERHRLDLPKMVVLGLVEASRNVAVRPLAEMFYFRFVSTVTNVAKTAHLEHVGETSMSDAAVRAVDGVLGAFLSSVLVKREDRKSVHDALVRSIAHAGTTASPDRAAHPGHEPREKDSSPAA